MRRKTSRQTRRAKRSGRDSGGATDRRRQAFVGSYLAACEFCKEPTMTQHTPGPWTHEGQGYIKSESADAAGSRVCIIQRNVEANARLIAAAPDLLEALRSILPLAVHTSPEDV